MSTFEYDIAISFLQEDEQLALNLLAELKSQFDVFIYSKRQDKLAGTDGQNTFTDIFSKKSRAVLVLYRENWGKTKWTRVEETAIKTRWFNDGHDFLLLIPIEESKPPKWFPEVMIYYDYKTFGFKGLPPVIYSHLKRNGAKEKEISLNSKIERIEREKKFIKELNEYLLSSSADQEFKIQIQRIFDFLEKKCKEINSNFETMRFEVIKSGNKSMVRHNDFELNFTHRTNFISTQKTSDIIFQLFKGYHVGYLSPDEKPSLLREENFLMSKDRIGNIIWKSEYGEHYLTEELVEKKLEEIINVAN